MDQSANADFVTILSSELIEEVMEEYFKKLYRRRVRLVDSRPTTEGYMFSLSFVTNTVPVLTDTPPQTLETTAIDVPIHSTPTPTQLSLYDDMTINGTALQPRAVVPARRMTTSQRGRHERTAHGNP